MPASKKIGIVMRVKSNKGIYLKSKKFEYRHKWKVGDFVIWDNRILMHKANGDYDMNERRYLFRIMLKGDKPY